MESLKLRSTLRSSIVSLLSAIGAIAMASPGDQWSAVTWDAVHTSLLWDYTEGSGSLLNPRQFTHTGSYDVLVHDVDYDSAGNLYAVAIYTPNGTTQAISGVFSVHMPSAALTLLAPVPIQIEGDMSYDPTSNRLVVVTSWGSTLRAEEILLSSGNAVNSLFSQPGFDDVSGLAIDSTGAGVLVDGKSNSGGNSLRYAFFNSGAFPQGPLGVGAAVTHGLDYNSSDQLHLLTAGGGLYHDTGSGLGFVENVFNPSGQMFTGLAHVPVPEPASLSILAIGIAAALRRRRSAR